MTIAIGLLQRCDKLGIRFSLDVQGGVLVANDELLDAGEMTKLRRHRAEIKAALERARCRRIIADTAGELAVLEAAAIVRDYAITG